MRKILILSTRGSIRVIRVNKRVALQVITQEVLSEVGGVLVDVGPEEARVRHEKVQHAAELLVGFAQPDPRQRVRIDNVHLVRQVYNRGNGKLVLALQGGRPSSSKLVVTS